MNYAIISLCGSQYRVSENDLLTVDNLNLAPDQKSSVTDVLLLSHDGKITIGQPTVPNCSVEYQIVKNYPAKKLLVSTYRAKSRYHKTHGFRHLLTDIKILKINS